MVERAWKLESTMYFRFSIKHPKLPVLRERRSVACQGQMFAVSSYVIEKPVGVRVSAHIFLEDDRKKKRTYGRTEQSCDQHRAWLHFLPQLQNKVRYPFLQLSN